MPIFRRLLVSLLLRVETQLVSRFHPHYVPINTATACRSSAVHLHPTTGARAVIESLRAHYRRVLQFVLDAVLVLTPYVFFLGSTLTRSVALQHHSH
jgi:hypothetical protein